MSNDPHKSIAASKKYRFMLTFFIKGDDTLGKGLRGGSILAVGSFIENVLRFIRNIILARLLAPEAFGLMATVISSVAVIEALTQVGLRQSTIQNKSGSDEGFLNAVWWMSSLRGLTLYLIAFFSAPYISAYFGRPDSAFILRIGFLVIFINGLISPRAYILEKELRFKKWVIMMQGAGVAGVFVAIVAAFLLKNVWALLFGFLTEALLRTSLSFIFCPLIPRLKLDKSYTAEIMKFSRRLFGLPIIMMIYAQIDIFIIGKVLSMQLLGIYVLVKGLAEMPMEFFSKIVHPVTLPVFSSMQDDMNKIRNTLFSITRITGLFAIPLIAFLFLFAEPTLYIVYGYEYSKLALPFGILCVATLILLISSLIVQVYFAIGQPNMHRTASFVRTTVFMILIYPATKYFGLTGTAIAALIAVLSLILTQLIYAHKRIDLVISDYLRNWLPGIQASFIIIIPGVTMHMYCQNKGISFLVAGILLCFSAWGYGIYRNVYLKSASRLQES